MKENQSLTLTCESEGKTWLKFVGKKKNYKKKYENKIKQFMFAFEFIYR